MANDTCFTHIAFEMDNVNETLAAALKNGGKTLGKVTGKVIEEVGILNFVYLGDPEDNIVEI